MNGLVVSTVTQLTSTSHLGVRLNAVAADGHHCQSLVLILLGKNGDGLCMRDAVADAAAVESNTLVLDIAAVL